MVRTYFYPGRMHEGVESDIPPAPVDAPAASLDNHWVHGIFRLNHCQMLRWSICPQSYLQPSLALADDPSDRVERHDLSWATTASPPYPEYHPEVAPTSEEDPFEE